MTELTRQYWLNAFNEWAEARLSPPQYDEAHQVLVEAGMTGIEQDGWIDEGVPRFVPLDTGAEVLDISANRV